MCFEGYISGSLRWVCMFHTLALRAVTPLKSCRCCVQLYSSTRTDYTMNEVHNNTLYHIAHSGPCETFMYMNGPLCICQELAHKRLLWSSEHEPWPRTHTYTRVAMETYSKLIIITCAKGTPEILQFVIHPRDIHAHQLNRFYC